MPGTIIVPDRGAAQTGLVDLDTSTKIDGEKKESSFQAEFPKSLGDAVAIHGEDAIFMKVFNALVIEAQGEERRKLQAQFDESKTTRRGKYITQLLG